MFVRIKSTVESVNALYKANVPLEVIERVQGNVVELNSNHEYMTKLGGMWTCWGIPTDCFEPVKKEKQGK